MSQYDGYEMELKAAEAKYQDLKGEYDRLLEDYERAVDESIVLGQRVNEIRTEYEDLVWQREQELRQIFARQSREEDEFGILYKNGQFEDGLMDHPTVIHEDVEMVLHRRKTDWEPMTLASEDDVRDEGN